MLNCNECSFEVNFRLKYSLINNVCPVCGASLLGDKEVQSIKQISSAIRAEHFSDAMSDVLIYDISLFVYSKYLKIEYVGPPADKVDGGDSNDEVGAQIEDGQDSQEGRGDAAPYEPLDEPGATAEEDLRAEARREALEALRASDDSGLEAFSDETKDEDLKVARLKRLAREARLSAKTGVKVTRVGRSD
tara:strand:+ start:61207 stop:61776 length:570 start_codon:yes stop_codon:yes gene_type:complete